MLKNIISIVVPILNEENNINLFYGELSKVCSSLNYDSEIIFVDDGSTDGSLQVLRRLAAQDQKIKVIEFTKNFGKEMALTAGLREATGGAIISLDADLQHPVKLIPKFIAEWESGAEVVVGLRGEGNHPSGLLRAMASKSFYRIINNISNQKFVEGATDFRLLDRKVADVFKLLSEKKRLTRALIDWLGFRTSYIEFLAPARKNGKSRYGWIGLTKIAGSAFMIYSLLPLRLASYLGWLITPVSGVLGFFILVEKYFLDDPLSLNFSGPAMLAVFNLFLIGIVLICLGMMAMYIANIREEVLDRPMYVVRSRINL